jgi:hypothetical protein
LRAARELFSGLNCWLNSVTSFCCFVAYSQSTICPINFFILCFSSVEPYPSSGGTPDFYYTPTSSLLSGIHSKKAVKPRVIESGNKSNPSSYFLFFPSILSLFFRIRYYYADELWPLGFFIFLIFFLFYYWISFTNGKFLFHGSIASLARARWPLRPGSCSSDLQDERRHRDWSRADGQSSGLLWVPHMWAQFS